MERPPPYTTTLGNAARDVVVRLFDRLGFEPELSDDPDRILLHRCPFLDVARRHQDVVCSLHLGILRGALQALGAPLDAREIEPFVEPSLCIARLAAADG